METNTPESREGVVSAAETLRGIWSQEKFKEGDVGEDAVGALANLLVALRLLGDLATAVELVKEGIESGVSSSEFYLRATVVAMESRSPELNIEELLSKVSDSPEKRMIHAQVLMAKGDWEALAAFRQEDIEALPSAEQPPFSVAVELARITIGQKNEIDERLRELVSKTSNGLRCYTIIANFCVMLGREDLADEAYEKARSLVTADSHSSGRFMLARHAFSCKAWSDVVDLLIDHVDPNVDSQELLDFTTALVSEKPIRQGAAAFFKRLPNHVRQLPNYRHAEGFLHHFRGDLKLAEACLRDALKAHRADDLLLLVSVLRQQQKDAQAEHALREVSLDDLVGVPEYRMAVAQELLTVGRSEEALEYGYRLATELRNDPQVALKYSGLMFRAFDLDLIPSPSVVGLDTTFRLDSDEGKTLWLTIYGSEDRVSEGVVSPTHPFSSKATGHPVGYSFTMGHGFQKEQSWTVREIKHKYLSLFHEIMDNFDTRFPDTNGISSFTMKDHDVEPVLAQVKRMADGTRKLAELYTEKRTPLSMVAAHLHRDPVSFSGYLRSNGHDIMTCVGQHAERLEAMHNIDRHRAAGGVLDTYTAWTVACMGAFDALKAVFGQLVIPRSVLHDLNALLGDDEYVERQSMSVSWHNGQFYKHIQTREEFESRRDFIREKIEIIEAQCDVVPVDAPASTDGFANKLAELFGPEPLHSGAIAGNGYILISEDYHYRKWAEQLWSVKGTWLQPSLEYALHSGFIRQDQYASWIAQLAQERHGFVYLNGQTILALVDGETTTDWPRLSAALQYIGTENADLISHVNTIVNFVGLALDNGVARGLQFEKTLGMLLENLTRRRVESWHELIWYIYSVMPSRIRGYIRGWMKGHFLDMTPVLHLEKIYLEKTADLAASRILNEQAAYPETVAAPRHLDMEVSTG